MSIKLSGDGDMYHVRDEGDKYWYQIPRSDGEKWSRRTHLQVLQGRLDRCRERLKQAKIEYKQKIDLILIECRDLEMLVEIAEKAPALKLRNRHDIHF
jgi:hypothetical protein